MHVGIIGGGMTGLGAADELSRNGIRCTVFEKDSALGGLAGSFQIDGVYLEKFYHHLFTSDTAAKEMIERVGLADDLQWLPTSNCYYLNRIYRLSTPLDLLRFTAVGFMDRIRLGALALRVRTVKDWRPLEQITARDWLIQMAGEGVYRGVWEPLLRGKFGRYADEVAAVWIWNKLKLRGGSRGSKQEERLGYVRGGFGRAIDLWEKQLRERRGVPFEFGGEPGSGGERFRNRPGGRWAIPRFRQCSDDCRSGNPASTCPGSPIGIPATARQNQVSCEYLPCDAPGSIPFRCVLVECGRSVDPVHRRHRTHQHAATGGLWRGAYRLPVAVPGYG